MIGCVSYESFTFSENEKKEEKIETGSNTKIKDNFDSKSAFLAFFFQNFDNTQIVRISKS